MKRPVVKKTVAAFAAAWLAISLAGCSDSPDLSGAEVQENAKSAEDSDGQNLDENSSYSQYTGEEAAESVDISDIPEYSGDAYVEVNGNEPFFTEEDYTLDAFETYSDLDYLGRCGAAYANICTELMPTEERGDISEVHPSGWTSGNDPASWNRCHLIAFKLAGENANEKNLVTGTEYMNTEGMTSFEDTVYKYAKWEDMHVLYRVTPLFSDENLVCSGVLMEGYSVEDGGDSVEFCVYCYNVEPGVTIDYETGQSWDEEDAPSDTEEKTFVVNTRTMKFHNPDCDGAQSISSYNKKEITGTRKDLIHAGYEPCRSCNP